MITVTTTAGTEVEGFTINDHLEGKLATGLNDFQKARWVGDLLESYLTLAVAVVDSIPIDQALVIVKSNTARIS